MLSSNFYISKKNNPYIVILHGLLGSSSNWKYIGKLLSYEFNVYLIDLINHGSSSHRSLMSLESMANDLKQWIDVNLKEKYFFLLGHSLGGKVAMIYTLLFNNNQIKGLIIEDIAPKRYCHILFYNYISYMLKINLNTLVSRKQAFEILNKDIPNKLTCQFLLTNLVYLETFWKWKCNLKFILNNIVELMGFPLINNIYYVKTLFIKGSNSNYILLNDLLNIRKNFPKARLIQVENTNHNIHQEDPKIFLNLILDFIK